MNEPAQYKILMEVNGMYGVAVLPKLIFDKLEKNYFIAESNNKIIFMCANKREEIHLKELGILIPDTLYCDWFKLIQE